MKNFTLLANCKKSAFAFLAVLFCLTMKTEAGFGQAIPLISASDGGFETGTTFAANGWNVVNNASTTANNWVVGTATVGGGSRSAYISNTNGSTYNYDKTTASTVHLYRSITVPTGATGITLSFLLKSAGEQTNWDQLLVFYGTGALTTGTPSGQTTTLSGYTNVFTQASTTTYGSAYQTVTITLPNSLAGTTFNLVFTWKNDGSSAAQPPASVDNISLTYLQTYIDQFSNLSTNATSAWCPGETRNVSVTVKNNGTATWTSGATGVNLSYWWTPGQNRDFNARVLPFVSVAPGASQVVTTSVTAPSTAGTYALNFDLVKEGSCWFGDNTTNCSGPGNVVFTTSNITVNALPSITGQSTATQTRCQGVAATAMSVTATGTGLTYQWYSNTTASNSGGTPISTATLATFTPPTTTPGTLYYYCVVSGSCTPAATSAVSGAIIVNPLPVAAGTITGTATVCQGQTGVAYSVPAITNATGYVWTLPTGATIASGTNTNSITVNYSNTAVSGNVTVYGTNACGNGTVSANYAVNVNPLPVAAGTITGTTPVCQGQNSVPYSVPAITNATSYTWLYSGTGATITGTGNSVSISFSNTATAGILTVKGTNSCGNGTVSPNYNINVNPLPAAAGTITGTTPVCQGQNTVSYTIPAIANAISYTWAYSGTGATITGTSNTVTISFSNTATSGNLTVTGTNSCGSGTISPAYPIAVNLLPAAAGAVTGTSPVCQGQTGVAYSVGTIANATSYTWSYNGTGATINGTGNSITINFSPTATSGNLTVTGVNSCGSGTVSAAYPVTVNPLPVASGSITGTSAVCQGSTSITYSVGTIANATSYTWAYSGTGATINGTSNSVTLDFSATATSGNLTVTGVNSCGNGTISANYSITVNQPPVITANPSPATQILCATANVSYSVTASGTGLTYQWLLNGNPIIDGGRKSGATTSTFTITGITAADQGDYTVVVSGTSPCSSATSAIAHLDVNQSIIFTAQPVTPQTICQGSSYTIFAQATGATGVGATYQWYHNGNPYATGTFDGVDKYTLIIPAVAPADAGAYRLYLDDGSGTTCSKANSNIATLVVNPTPTATISGDATVCQSSSPAPLVTFTNPNALPVTITYNINGTGTPTINVAANSTATVAASTGTAGTFAYNLVSVVYQSGPGCDNSITGTATVTVNPTPDVTATPSSQPVCSGTAITTIALTGSVTGTTFAWTRDNTASVTGIAASGNGDISGTLINSTNAPITVTFTITPTANTCVGSAITATVIVNPTATVTAVTNKTVCNNGTVAAINFGSPTTGGTIVYNWTNNTPSIGLAASGTGNIASFTATNTGSAPVTATITVTPSYTNGGTTCTGTPSTFTITVNPTATVNSVSNQTVCKGASTTAVTFSSPTTGGTIVYNWTNNTPSIGLAASGTGNIASFTATNTGSAPVTATITVTPSYTNGTTCTGTPITFTITVNPAATVTGFSNQTVCNNGATAAETFTSPTTGGTIVYNWTNNTPSIGLAASGTGNIASFTATNTGSAPVTATITVTPSYTNGGTTCTGTPSTFTITVNPTATVNSVSNQTVCKGASTTAVTFSSPTTGGTIVYNWTNNTPSIGLAASGTGNIASFTATNTGSAPVTATITVTPSYTNGTTCTGTPITFTITVNPAATVTGFSNQTVCNNGATAAETFTSPTTGGTIVYNWTNNTPSIGLAASGTGNIASFTATNTGSAPVTATITVTPSYTNGGTTCTGTPSTFTITVNPTATVTAVTNKTVCNNGTVAAINFGSPTTGGTIVYNWTNNTPSIGLAASGTGNIASFTATNTGSAPVTATITVTPSYTNGGTTCTGTPSTFTITVNPTATVNSVSNQTVCKGASTTAVTFSSPTTGGTIVYNWTNNTPSIGLAASGTGNIASFTATNTGSAPVTATITVTPSYTNGTTCTGTPITFTITVNPAATVTGFSNQTVCNNGATAAETFTSPTTGGTIVYNWTNNTPSIGLAASGTGNIASFTATNTGSAPVTATITVTPSYTNGGTTCTGTPSTFTITVNPTPNAIATPSSQPKCEGFAITTIVLTSTATPAANVTYTWTRDNTATVTGTGSFASASGSGNITGTPVVSGSSSVTVTFTITPTYSGGCVGTPTTATVTVNPQATAGAITGASHNVCIGSALQLTANGSGIGTLTYAWSSSNTAVATVNSLGLVTGVGTGSTNITYTVNDANGCVSATSAPYTVNITKPTANAITQAAGLTTVCVNSTLQLTSNATGTATLTYVWTSSNPAKATVSNTGLVTGLVAGTTNITYTVTDGNGCSTTSAAYTVTVLAVPSGSIIVTENSGTMPNDYNICAGDAVTFTAPSGYGSYTWKVNGAKVQGPNTDNTYSTTTLTAGQTVTVDIANANNCGATFTAPSVTVSPLPAPTLTVNENSGTPDDKIICPNASVTLTAPLNAGSTYSFIINGTTVSTGTSNTYTTMAIASNSTVAILETNSNGCQATSANQTITVSPVPAGTLSVSPGNSFCIGTSVTFTATAGFSNYNFKVNGVSKQNNATNTYITNALTNGQVVSVDVTNSNGCTTTFNPISVTVNPLPTGSLTATENSGVQNDNNICAGSPVTFTATSGYANYAFYLNGTGTALYNGPSNIYTTSTLVNNNYLTVVVTSAGGCTATFTSATITVVASSTGSLTETDNSGTANDDKMICASDNATFTATAGFSNYNFQVNGTAVQNGITNTFSSTSLANGDVVTVDVTNSNSCIITFNPVTMVVNPLPTGTLAIAENAGTPNDGIICTGTSVTFTAPNGFTNYNFLLNGVSVQSGALKTYTTTTLANGDKVTVAITGTGGCIGLLNQYTITVNPLPTVAPITTTASSFDVCAGSSITLQDATNTGGTFTWSSENPGIATVNASTGVVTGVAAGTAVIDYTFTNSNGCSSTVTATITVHALPTVQPITGNFNICTGTNSQLSDATTGGIWSSSNTSVATVDATGLVNGVAPGNATISYSITDAFSCSTTVTADVTVSDFPYVAPITTTSPSSFNVCLGNTIQLKDATTGGTWSIVNGSGTATISSAGVVTGTSAGTVTAYYSINASCGLPASSSQVINVNAPPSANIFYTGSPFCTTSSPVSVTQTGTTGGTYSSTSGLTINASDGIITPSSSTAGTYTITYTIPATATGGCGVYTATTSVTITAAPSATIAYSASPYCSNGGTATVTRTGTAGGTYTKTAGAGTLSINASTGDITLGTSTPGTYTVTYTVAASGGCSLFSATASVTITAAPSATIAYSASPYCSNGGTATVTQTGTSGGTYTKTSGAGTLSLNSATGAITLGTSTPGTYTVTYTVAASAGCAIFTTTTSVTITAAPTAVAGTAVITCSNNPPVNITAGSSGTNYSTIVWTSSGTGTFANQGSLTATTYAPSAADITAGSVTLTLKANGNGGCVAATSTKTLTISAPPPAFVITPSGTINICQGSVQPITATVNASSTSSTTVSSGNINLSIPDALDFFFFIVPGSVTNNLNVMTVPAGAIINSVSVNFNITHTYDGDLVLNLRAPNGKVLNLVDQKGKGGKNFTNTTVSSISTNPFLNGAANAPFTGTFVADGDNGVGTPLSGNTVFYDLFSVPNGTWTFGAEDDGPADVGKILNWSITFNYTIPGTPLSTIWSPTTDLYTDPGATTAYTGTALSTVYAKPASSGTKVYTATVTNAASCSTSQNVTLNVGAAPVVTVTADYCAVAGKVKLTANSTPAATSYLWSTGETTQSILVDVSGIYSVTVYAAGSTCPGKGTINVANELITNGNFEAGNVAFTSSYPYRTGAGSLNNPPGYAVDTAANYYGPTFLWGKDHTTGHGKFMMVNGAAGANYQIWQQTISVLPNTTYYFSAWGLELDNLPTTLQDGAPANAQLQFNVNGTQTGTLGNLPRPNNPQTDADNNQWVRFYGSWTSGPTTTSAVVSITDLQGAVYGNNFGLDDISFGTLSTFVELQSAVGTDAQTVCVNNPIANIVYSAGSSASAPTITGLPSGVTSSWNGVYLTISGTPTVAGNYSYTITTTGSCQPATATGTITVQAQKIALSSGNSSPSVCANTAMSNIVFTLSGTAINATTTGLPAGVTGTKSGSGPTYIYTLSGTPTATPGSYPYTITTSGTCSPVTFNGIITVTSQSITLNSANNTQTVCINSPTANIQYTVGGTGTGAIVSGLPPGVTGSYNSGLFVISGSPTSAAGSPYNYTVTTSGTSCAVAAATGTITVTPAASFTLTSGAATNPQTVCKGTAITNITYSVIYATGASATGLPAGVTGNYSGGVFTISGTSTAAVVPGTYNYTVTSSGGCAVGTTTGSITVQAQTISLSNGTASPQLCANSPMSNIVYTIGGTATGAMVTGLPTGVNYLVSGTTLTISGTPTAASGPYSYTVTTTGTCTAATATGTITILPAPVGGSVASISSICSGQNGSLTLSGNTGSVVRWEFSINGGSTWTPTSPANTTITQSFTNITVPTQYRAVVGNNCSNVFSSVATISIHNYWTGITSSDWQTASNWSDNQVASGTCSMYMIPGSTPNQPQLTLSNTNVSNITIASNATLDLNGKKLTVTGALSGNGTLIGNATSSLVINSGTGNDTSTVYFKKGRPYNQLKTLMVNSGILNLGGSLASGDTLNIVGGDISTGYGTVNVNGTLNTNGILALLSDANGTAQVGISSGTITGEVTVQRNYPAGVRAWRFVGLPFKSSTQTINKAWQEGHVYTDYSSCNPATWDTPLGIGTEISYNNVSASGYDYHNNTYKTSIQTYQDGLWRLPSSGTYSNLVNEPNSQHSATPGFPGYALFIRGDRTVCLSGIYPSQATTLRPKGILNQDGNPVNRTIGSTVAGDYVMVGNPYAATVDISGALSNYSSGIMTNKFLVWDPTLGGSLGVGGYATSTNGVMVPGASAAATAGPRIQSGEAFMALLNTNTTSGALTFHESDKTSYQNINVFGLQAAGTNQTPSVVYANLIDTTNAIMDGVAGAFGDGYSANVDSIDASKRWNEEIENMALIRHDTALAIEFRPMPKASDTLFFRLYLRQHPYRLKVFSQTLAPNFSSKAWIVDKYLGTQTEINLRDTSIYNFTPNSDTNSYRNRFELVFSPVSSDRIARLDSLINKIRSRIYPNPVSGRVFRLVLENARKDNYTVNIFTTKGALAATRKISGEEGTNNWDLPLSAALTSGSYTVQVLNSSGVIVSALPLIISR